MRMGTDFESHSVPLLYSLCGLHTIRSGVSSHYHLAFFKQPIWAERFECDDENWCLGYGNRQICVDSLRFLRICGIAVFGSLAL